MTPRSAARHKQGFETLAIHAGQDPEGLPVTARIKDQKVGDALKSIIKDFNLAYAIIGDTVYVSTNEMAMQRQLKQHVAVDFEKVELAKALEQLKKETATNIVLDTKAEKAAKTLVTLQLDDVPLESAVCKYDSSWRQKSGSFCCRRWS